MGFELTVLLCYLMGVLGVALAELIYWRRQAQAWRKLAHNMAYRIHFIHQGRESPMK